MSLSAILNTFVAS